MIPILHYLVSHQQQRVSKEQKHEYGLLGAAVCMMLPIERKFMCQLALTWGTRQLISPELAGKDVIIGWLEKM
jgi:hypothetical protein